jgi:ribonuclease P/MRP protein subunit RPP1
VHTAFSEGESSLEQLAVMAKQLGYAGICFAEYYKNDGQISELKKEIEKVKQKVGIEILLGFEARTIKELDMLRQRRKKFDVLLVRGGDLRLNRKACETPEVDILTHPEYGRMDSGLNHVMIKLAAKNNVAIEINFRQVVLSSKKTRSKIIENMKNNASLAKKLHANIIICSGALSHWDLNDPLCMISFATLLGLDINKAKDSLSKVPENILKSSKKRLDKNWVMPGVEVVK